MCQNTKYAAEHGNKAAISKFSAELCKPMADSTVGTMKKAYYLKLREEPQPNKITSLPYANRGHPLMLGSYKWHCTSRTYVLPEEL